MAKKTKEVKPFPTALGVLLLLIALGLMVVFAVYVVSPMGGETSHVDSLGEQSFATVESSEPPPPEVVEVKEYMSDAKVGDIVTYGSYEQNGVADDGAEPIEWVVLDETDTSLLLVSRYCLACKPYNDSRVAVDWANSSLRQWLNGEFCNTAFTEKELSGIVEISETSSDSDAVTITDKVSILTAASAEKYYEYDTWRAAAPTPAAVADGAREEDGNCWYWLRYDEVGNSSDMAKYIHFNGVIKDSGFAVDYNAVAVRPVIWVSADAEKETDDSSVTASVSP